MLRCVVGHPRHALRGGVGIFAIPIYALTAYRPAPFRPRGWSQCRNRSSWLGIQCQGAGITSTERQLGALRARPTLHRATKATRSVCAAHDRPTRHHHLGDRRGPFPRRSAPTSGRRSRARRPFAFRAVRLRRTPRNRDTRRRGRVQCPRSHPRITPRRAARLVKRAERQIGAARVQPTSRVLACVASLGVRAVDCTSTKWPASGSRLIWPRSTSALGDLTPSGGSRTIARSTGSALAHVT